MQNKLRHFMRILLPFFLSTTLLSCSTRHSEPANSSISSQDSATRNPDSTLATINNQDTTRQPSASSFYKNFELIEDFEQNKTTFTKDSFDIYELSTDGGQLTAFHHNDKDYVVSDIWLFGETGKVHVMYWTDKQLTTKLVKRTYFEYDKPYYEKNFKIEETTEYYSFIGNHFQIYDSMRNAISQPDDTEKAKNVKELLTDVSKVATLVK
jgi:hypothetical protein